MSITDHQTNLLGKLKPWQIILLFGMLLCVVYGIGSFTFDYYAGSATAPFGVWPEVDGVGMFFIYILSYYFSLIVVLPIMIIRQFGVGVGVFLPYAITGLFIEYYIEWIELHTLRSPWAVLGWCAIGLLVGLSTDLSYRFLPDQFNDRSRAIATGIVMGVTNFLLVIVALSFFYVHRQSGPGSFLGVAYYGLPFLIINSGFGGYTAYAISRNV